MSGRRSAWLALAGLLLLPAGCGDSAGIPDLRGVRGLAAGKGDAGTELPAALCGQERGDAVRILWRRLAAGR